MVETLQWLWLLLLTSLLGWFFKSRKSQHYFELSVPLLLLGFGWSILGGAVYYGVYTFYYKAEASSIDTFKFYEDAKVLVSHFGESPTEVMSLLIGIYNHNAPEYVNIFQDTHHWFRPYDYGGFNDNQLIIRLNVLIWPLTMGFYPLHIVFFTTLRYLGLLFMYKVLSSYVNHSKILFAGFMLLPSLWFWSSGVMKEPILLFGMGLFLWSFHQLWNFRSSKYLIFFIFSFTLLVMVKSYVLICLLPALLYLLLQRHLKKVKAVGLTILIVATGIVFLHEVTPKNSLLTKVSTKQRDFKNVAELSDAGSAFSTFTLTNNYYSFIYHLPEALFNGTVRPIPNKKNGLLSLVSGIEGWILLLFLVLPTLNWRVLTPAQQNLWLAALLFAFFLYLIIGYTTVVSGEIVRYRIPAAFSAWIGFTISMPSILRLWKK